MAGGVLEEPGLRLLLSEVMVHRSTGRHLRAWGGWSMLAQHGAQPGAQGLDKSDYLQYSKLDSFVYWGWGAVVMLGKGVKFES